MNQATAKRIMLLLTFSTAASIAIFIFCKLLSVHSRATPEAIPGLHKKFLPERPLEECTWVGFSSPSWQEY